MIDIETIATEDNAIVTSVGIVKMDMDKLVVLDETAYHVLDWKDQFDKGRIAHPSTVRFWLAQDKDAQSAMITDTHPAWNNYDHLKFFGLFLKDCEGIWGNGADFDCSIMRSLYRSYKEECPWTFRQHRCFRTIKSLYPVGRPEREGVAHNALDDAKYQAKWLMNILREQRKIAAAANGDPEEFQKYE